VADHYLKLFQQHTAILEQTAKETLARLCPEDAWVFVDLSNDQIDVLNAVSQVSGSDEVHHSLVLFDLTGQPQQLFVMGVDLLHGRYEDVRRALRFVWESAFRAFYADCFTLLCPADPNPPGPTIEDKIDWLDRRGRQLNWGNLVLRHLFPGQTRDEIEAQFQPLWKRLNAAVHPSAEWRAGGLQEPNRHLWFHFDEGQARQLIDDARNVFTLVWVAILQRFPLAAASLAGNSNVFRACPQVRLLLPTERTETTPG
jgi:hypothetical protein